MFLVEFEISSKMSMASKKKKKEKTNSLKSKDIAKILNIVIYPSFMQVSFGKQSRYWRSYLGTKRKGVAFTLCQNEWSKTIPQTQSSSYIICPTKCT